MIILKKKYRLIWNNEGEIIGEPLEEFPPTTETIVGDERNYFETDDINEINTILDEITTQR
jgi:hypothetical protein